MIIIETPHFNLIWIGSLTEHFILIQGLKANRFYQVFKKIFGGPQAVHQPIPVGQQLIGPKRRYSRGTPALLYIYRTLLIMYNCKYSSYLFDFVFSELQRWATKLHISIHSFIPHPWTNSGVTVWTALCPIILSVYLFICVVSVCVGECAHQSLVH